MPKELTASAFKASVIDADHPVLVGFYAGGCGPCQMQAPMLENIATRFRGTAMVFKADLAIWDMRGIETAGAWDPVAALIFCGPIRARDVLVEGRAVVRDGRFLPLDIPLLAQAAAIAVARLVDG